MKRAAVLLWIAVALTAPDGFAQAQVPQRARSLFTAGAQAFKRGDFATAIEAFEEAYRLDPRPGLLFSLAQTHRRQYHASQRPEQLTKAIQQYRAYLDAVPEGGRRAEAAQALVELEPLAARVDPAPTPPAAEEPPAPRTRVMVSSPAEDASVRVDGRAPRPCPLLAVVDPGKHVIRVSAPGYLDAQREILVEQATTLAVDVPLGERPGMLQIVTEDGADVLVDQRAVGAAPLPPIAVQPGRHVVAVLRSGRQAALQEVTVRRGENRRLRVPLERTGQRTVAWVLGGAGGAALLGAGAFAVVAAHHDARASSVLERTETGNISGTELATYQSAREARDDYAVVSLVTLGAGATLGTAAVLTWVFDRPAVPWAAAPSEPEPTPKRSLPEPLDVSVAPEVGPERAGGRVTLRF